MMDGHLKMAAYLNATKRPIVFSCEFPLYQGENVLCLKIRQEALVYAATLFLHNRRNFFYICAAHNSKTS